MSAHLYTASWSALHAADKAGWLDVQPVRISRGIPKFWPAATSFPALTDVTPDGWMLKIPEYEHERFYAAYVGKLDEVGPVAIRAQLDRLAEQHRRPLALACFEKPGTDGLAHDCHRGPRGFGGWWTRKGDELISEWAPDGPPRLFDDELQPAPEGAEGT